MSIKYKIKDNILYIDNRQMDLKFTVKKVLEIGDMLIILLGGTFYNKSIINIAEQPLNNICSIDKGGWRPRSGGLLLNHIFYYGFN